MKKTLSILSIFVLGTSLAFADTYNSVQVDKTRLPQAPKTLPGELPEITEIQDLPDFNPVQSVNYNASVSSTQNEKLQEALLKIDSAQVDVKNELNLYESKLVDVKNRESLVKQEKQGILKEIRAVKRKMNSLESAKKKIVSNMQDAESTSSKKFNWF